MQSSININIATTIVFASRSHPLWRLFKKSLHNLGYSISVFSERRLNFWGEGHAVSWVLGLRLGHKRGIDLTAFVSTWSNLC